MIAKESSYVADENESPDEGEDAYANSRGNVIAGAAGSTETEDDDGQKLKHSQKSRFRQDCGRTSWMPRMMRSHKGW